jgi:lipopolysaccharide/colanic/teichoic acid biosynthesis glycosyltransferase
MKRAFDFLLSSLGLLFLSPLFLLLAAAIRLDSPGPVFFRQKRAGKEGIPFRIFKFRSMVSDAPEKGPLITAAGDPRVTRVGRFLRRTKLDELPQLLNVWRGEMSLVGPRPEVPEYIALYDERQRKVLSVRPGITDPASILYADEEGILAAATNPQRLYEETILPRKLELNLRYIENMSLTIDISLILKTFSRIFVKR